MTLLNTEAYDDFIQKIMIAIDKVAPMKERRIKHNYISMSNYIMRLATRYISWFLIRKKIILKINECVGKPKELWKALKSLGLPNNTSSCEVRALEVNKTVQHDTNLVLGGLKDYYSNLAGNLLEKFPKPPNIFTLNTVFQYYKDIIQSDSFNLATV